VYQYQCTSVPGYTPHRLPPPFEEDEEVGAFQLNLTDCSSCTSTSVPVYQCISVPVYQCTSVPVHTPCRIPPVLEGYEVAGPGPDAASPGQLSLTACPQCISVIKQCGQERAGSARRRRGMTSPCTSRQGLLFLQGECSRIRTDWVCNSASVKCLFSIPPLPWCPRL